MPDTTESKGRPVAHQREPANHHDLCTHRVIDALGTLFKDNVKGRRLNVVGVWKEAPRPAFEAPFVAPLALHDQARGAWERREAALPDIFVLLTSRKRGPA